MASDPATSLLFDIAVVMAVAAVTTVLFHRVRMPTVLGYLAAGVIVGPQAFSLVENASATRVLAELGIVFLMFSVGLEFNLRKLFGVGPLLLVAASAEVLLMLWLGYSIGGWLGWAPLDRVFLGAVISISSTTILTKVLVELDMIRSEHATVVFAFLIVEDVVAVLLLTALSTLGLTGGIAASLVWDTLLQVTIFLVAALAIGLALVPRTLNAVASLGSDEVLVVSALGILLGTSLLAAELGFSVALGAFLVGALVAESRAAKRVEARISGLRDMFTAVFFVTIGMLIDPGILWAWRWPLLLVAVVFMLGKVLVVGIGAFVAGSRPATALRAGIAMAVVGEFSFVIADLGERIATANPGLDMPVTRDLLFPLVVGVSLVTASVSPLLIRESDAIVRGLARVAPRPLVGYVQFYHNWASGGGAAGGGRLEGARRQLGRAVLQLGGVVGVLAAAQRGARWVVENADARRIDVRLAIGVWIAGALLALPFALGFYRRSVEFVRRLTDAAVPAGEGGTPAGRVIRNTVGALATTALGALALVATAPFLPPGPVFVVVLAAVAASLYFLGESVLRMNRGVESAIERAMQGEPAEERQELRRLIETQYPWAVDSGRVTVPSGGYVAEMTLRDLQIRNRTGATVAVIDRKGEHVLNPEPGWRLEAGDRLTVIGEPAQVQAALDLVRTARAAAPDEEPAFREVEIPPGGALVGKTLAETRLRELTGATIMGLARDGRRLPHPPPDQRLAAGDVVLLMGSPGAVARAVVMLREVR